MAISGTGSNAARRPPVRAFTLLEVCLALAVVAALVGLCAPAITGWLSEQRLRDPARDIELLARTARTRAIDTQRSWAVLIRPTEMALTLQDGESLADDLRDANPDLTRPLAEGIAVATKAWGEDDFSTPAEVRWIFRPNGLCEPLSIRFTRGASHIALRFDPLTADIAEETYAFQ